MSDGIYSATKAYQFPLKIKELQSGCQPYPVHVQLILSDLCQHDCSFCAYRMSGYTSNQLFPDNDGNSNPNRKIPEPKVIEILEDCVAMGVKAVQLTGGGEPTIHKSLPLVLDFCHAHGIKSGLVTNGCVLPRRNWWSSLMNLSWVRISLDAGKRETYCKIRKVKSHMWKDALRAISQFCENRDMLGRDIVVGVGFVVTKENYEEIFRATKLARSLGADNIRISGVFSTEGENYFKGNWAKRAINMAKEAESLSTTEFTVHNRLNEKIQELMSGSPKRSFCGYQHFTTYIGGDQNVYRCCVYAYNKRGLIGSIQKQGFKQLWDSEKKRDNMAWFDAKGCSHCQFLDRNDAIAKAVDQQKHSEFV